MGCSCRFYEFYDWRSCLQMHTVIRMMTVGGMLHQILISTIPHTDECQQEISNVAKPIIPFEFIPAKLCTCYRIISACDICFT